MDLINQIKRIATELKHMDEKPWLDPVVPNGILVYHGTSTLGAAKSIQRGIKVQPPGPKAKYGEAFYVTTNSRFSASYAGPKGYIVEFKVLDGSRIITPPGVDYLTGSTDKTQFKPNAPEGTSKWWEQWWEMREQALKETGLTDEQLSSKGHARHQVARGIDGVAYTLNSLSLAIYNPDILEVTQIIPVRDL